jgi:hypothetical protein
MMKNCITMGALAKGEKTKDNAAGKVDAPFLGKKAVMSIYDGPMTFHP